ncbi:MAG: hypothetical protein H7Y06_07555, partial [Opitutaceae bacterium]|nr:hypothetical protein [Opitutaceae bacterium]
TANATFISPKGWITGTGKVGTTTATGNANYYISADGTHPSPEGHAYLGRKLASAILYAKTGRVVDFTDSQESVTVLDGVHGGTGVDNGAKTITLGGNLVTSGSSALTLTTTGTTNATLPAGTKTLLATDGSGASLTGIVGTQIGNTPAGGVAATTVQEAVTELDSEKAPVASPSFTGRVSMGAADAAYALTVLGNAAGVKIEMTADGNFLRFLSTTQGNHTLSRSAGTLVWTCDGATPYVVTFNKTSGLVDFNKLTATTINGNTITTGTGTLSLPARCLACLGRLPVGDEAGGARRVISRQSTAPGRPDPQTSPGGLQTRRRPASFGVTASSQDSGVRGLS